MGQHNIAGGNENEIQKEMSPWAKCLLVADIVVGVFVVAMIVVIIRRNKDAKLNPQKYLEKGEKNKKQKEE